ncbi:DNA (cytosine-5)-methyltransferase 3B, partial [Frankliniella fusca]
GGTPKKRGRKGKRGREPSSPPVSSLKNPQVGDLVWAKVKNYRWWPAILVDKEDCGKLVALGGRMSTYFVFWFGDSRVSPVALSNLVDFREGYQKFIKPMGNQIFKSGVYMAITELRKSLSLEIEDWNINKSFAWANEGFPLPEGCDESKTKETPSQYVRTKLRKLRMKYETGGDGSDDERTQDETENSTLYLEYPEEASALLHSVRDETLAIEEVCLACLTKVDCSKEHPLFLGGLCEICWINFVERYFAIGCDQVPYYCNICLKMGDMMVCSNPDCLKLSYCDKCIALKATLGVVDIIRHQDPWLCFLCEPYSSVMHGLLEPRTQWRQSILQIFHSNVPSFGQLRDVPIRILCLDGSCKIALKVFSALQLSNVNVQALFLCDYTEDEVFQVQESLPNAKYVNLLKSMIHYEAYEHLSKVKPIHLVIASFTGTEEESLGRMFFSFHNIVSMINIINLSPQQSYDQMWLFEAQPPQCNNYRTLMSRYLQVEPIKWSADKNDDKMYWTNVETLWAKFNEPKQNCSNKLAEASQTNTSNSPYESGSEEEACRYIIRRKKHKH